LHGALRYLPGRYKRDGTPRPHGELDVEFLAASVRLENFVGALLERAGFAR
jgi:hypothetical protein